ncbi:MAG: EI24 domain-containing protein [Flavobacteriales bacterium]|jgi:CysZ protein|nr:EI24 domain-containing protein [Flavobacteriales bacterium]
MRKGISLGFRTYFKSFSFIRKNKLSHFYLYPVLFLVGFSVFAFWGINYVVDVVSPFMNDLIGVDSLPGDGWWQKTLSVLKDVGRYLTAAVLWVSLIYIFHKISKYIILIFLSPVMSVVSEKTEELITGNRIPFSYRQLMRDVIRGSVLALRNMVVELLITVLLLGLNLLITIFVSPLTFISTPIVSVILFFVSAYYFGFSTLDYASERRKKTVAQSVGFVSQNKGLAVTNGSFFALWLMIPVLGTYIGTVVAPITCTVGATLAYLEIETEINS